MSRTNPERARPSPPGRLTRPAPAPRPPQRLPDALLQRDLLVDPDVAMKIENVPFTTVDWSDVPPIEHPGETGVARWRTLEIGNLRVRMVEYSPGYFADHWCERGHVILVLQGELVTDLGDGRRVVVPVGSSYQVGDGEPHRSSAPQGARLFIVD